MSQVGTGVNGSTQPATPMGKDDGLPMTLVNTMQKLFQGPHKGYRTTHAKGLLVEGSFTPSSEAKTLSVAAHFNDPSTPVVARFSVGGGLPHNKDTDPGATPKGIAIRFQVDENTHTDMIAHSFNGFATRTGEGFLEFLQIFGAFQVAKFFKESTKEDDPTYPQKKQACVQAVIALKGLQDRVPSVKDFLDGPKPNPHNYGTLTYYEPNTHVLTNCHGKITNVRYRLIPADGQHLYTDAELPGLATDYLEDDLKQRFPDNPIVFTIEAHIAEADDVLDDATKAYKSTTFIPVGSLELNKVSDDNAARQQQIAFSPLPDRGGIKGIQGSQDPLLQTRKAVYYISADQRRHDKQVE